MKGITMIRLAQRHSQIARLSDAELIDLIVDRTIRLADPYLDGDDRTEATFESIRFSNELTHRIGWQAVAKLEDDLRRKYGA
jgi:hypothetical protein